MAPNVRKRPERWRKKKELLLGLTERNPSDSSVVSVNFDAVVTGSSSAAEGGGRGEETRPISNVKHCRSPFRVDNMGRFERKVLNYLI